MSKWKPILCVDFDGVLHSYTSGWQGADVVADSAVPGAAEWLEDALEIFEVHIYSSRTSQKGGIRAMQEWCALEFGGEFTKQLHFPEQKPAAFLTIDDRAICFDGNWPDVKKLQAFKPWNKQ